MGSYGKITQGASSVPAQVTLQNAVTANGNGTAMEVSGYATAILQSTVTANAAVYFEGSVDGGSTYVPVWGTRLSGVTVNTGIPDRKTSYIQTGVDGTSAVLWSFNVAGFTHLRARVSSYSSGTITVTGTRSVLTYPSIQFSPTSGMFTACNPQYTVPATPTEMVTLYGPTGQTIARVLRIELLTEQTTAGTNFIYLYRRTTAASGGTPVAVTPADHDPTGNAVLSTMNYYTANPTVGSGTTKLLDGYPVLAPAAATHVSGVPWREVFRAYSDEEAIVLRSSAEGLAFNFNGAALPAGFKIQVRFTWKEEYLF